MATVVCNGCFDILHEGHKTFLTRARQLGTICDSDLTFCANAKHRLIVAVNTDESARRLKASKWGDKYPIDNLTTRCQKLCAYADEVCSFDTEEELRGLIELCSPCILVKGPDYAGKSVTGDDLAPVIILDTPEPESVKNLKIEAYSHG
jgi:D-beta-D-heptose 7-phosphate kinase / D-beta-D-heptose 1-phosphate adenosyltransferase